MGWRVRWEGRGEGGWVGGGKVILELLKCLTFKFTFYSAYCPTRHSPPCSLPTSRVLSGYITVHPQEVSPACSLPGPCQAHSPH